MTKKIDDTMNNLNAANQTRERLLEKALESIVKGGHVLITSPSRRSITPLVEALRKRLGERDHVRAGYSTDDLKNMLGRHGAEVISAGYMGQFFSSVIHYMVSIAAARNNIGMETGRYSARYHLYSLFWPLLRAISLLDSLIPRTTEGGFVVVLARKK